VKHPYHTDADIITRAGLRKMAAAGWRVYHSMSCLDGELLSMRNGDQNLFAFLPTTTVLEGAQRDGLAELGNALACLERLKTTRIPISVRGMVSLAEGTIQNSQAMLAQIPAEPDPMPTQRQTSFQKGGL
jgi:hypothetical protein